MKKRRKNSNYGGGPIPKRKQKPVRPSSMPLELSYIPKDPPSGEAAFMMIQRIPKMAQEVVQKVDPETMLRIAQGEEVRIDDFIFNVDANRWKLNLDHLVEAGLLTRDDANSYWEADQHCRRTTNPGTYNMFE